MTAAFTPAWTDGLTHADAAQIRAENLDWAEHYRRQFLDISVAGLRKRIEEYHVAHAALEAREAELGGWTVETYHELGKLSHERDQAAYAVVGYAQGVVQWAPKPAPAE